MGFGRRKKKEAERPFLSVVVAAAGSSDRMGFNKLFAEVAGQPVLAHTLLALDQAEVISEIIVVVRDQDIPDVGALCRELNFNKVTKVIRGGARRVDSVFNGVLETDSRATLIGIHDGARPLVTEAVITEAAQTAEEFGAAVPAVPVTDTIRRVDVNGRVLDTPDRSSLYAMQTPQIFDADILKGALQKTLEEGRDTTDDAAAVEAVGMPVHLTTGSQENIKLTWPPDILTAEGILAERYAR